MLFQENVSKIIFSKSDFFESFCMMKPIEVKGRKHKQIIRKNYDIAIHCSQAQISSVEAERTAVRSGINK